MNSHDPADGTLQGIQSNKQIHLTPEELAVLKKCNSEGFYSRGLPAGLGLTMAAFYGLKYGYFKPHPRFGMLPALSVAGIVGCVTGSLSYKSICVERLLAVPNGTLKQQFEAMNGPQRGRIAPANVLPEKYEIDGQGPMVSGSQMDIYQSNNNFDGFTGVNSDGDQPSNYDTAMPLSKYSSGLTTYDDLRQKNREDYIRSSSTRPNVPPPRTAPQHQGYPSMGGPPGPIFEDTRPFDRDRVPQYHLD